MARDPTDRPGRPTAFLPADEKRRVEAAIRGAERRTSAEIRVVVSRKVKGDPLDAARRLFARLKMHETRERNGVLILLAVAERRFAIYGDEGIHQHLGQDGWERVRDGMADRFRRGEFADGLVYAVEAVGRVLAEAFPWQEGDENELPDAVVEE